MQALAYSVTKHTIPGWGPFHKKEQRGLAYEADTHFVHFFGRNHGLWIISTGLTVTQRKSGGLTDWIRDTFGAVDVEPTKLEPGHTVAGVWRPGLYFSDETLEGLSGFDFEFRLSQQALLLLIQRLDELLHFVEPSPTTLKTYGHKARELLILSCTEVENSWKAYMRMAGLTSSAADFTTKDYVKLLNPFIFPIMRYLFLGTKTCHRYARFTDGLPLSPPNHSRGTTPTTRQSTTGPLVLSTRIYGTAFRR